MPRGCVKKKKGERSVADRESSIALCHGMALKKERGEIGRGPREQYRSVPRDGVKKKGSVEDRESGVALCHKVALKKKKRRERERSVADRESSIAQCHGVALKKKQRKKKMIGRGPRERCIAIPRFGINNAL